MGGELGETEFFRVLVIAGKGVAGQGVIEPRTWREVGERGVEECGVVV